MSIIKLHTYEFMDYLKFGMHDHLYNITSLNGWIDKI